MNLDILLSMVSIVIVYSMGFLVPGPNFIIITRNSMAYSRQTGLYTGFGVATGSMLHIILGFLGISAIVAQSIYFFNILKIMGALYLIYLGLKAFMSRGKTLELAKMTQQRSETLLKEKAYQIGLFTMLSNPKAAVTYLVLFTTFIDPATPVLAKVILAVVMVALSFIWHSFLALFFSNAMVQSTFVKFRRWVDYMLGGLLIGFGIKIAVTK